MKSGENAQGKGDVPERSPKGNPNAHTRGMGYGTQWDGPDPLSR